jgi:hypothetical protein
LAFTFNKRHAAAEAKIDAMAAKVDKVILTNFSALRAKYGGSGLRAVRSAIRKLIAADRRRGLITTLIALDDARTMRAFSARPVTRAANARQNKEAVDAVYRKFAPDYILLLGSVDVIPHQELKNPLYDKKGEDTDIHAPGDLPYACECGYSNNIGDFLGPTRVVGRLPDLAGAREPSFLLGVLKAATEGKPAGPETYSDYFAVSAQIWVRSTKRSAQNIFRNSKKTDVITVPPNSSRWPPELLERRVHFINCHGANHATEFYGQPSSGKAEYPVSLKTSYIDGKISPGTVAAAECCYGGQLKRISESNPRLGICEAYLKDGAYAFAGSTTVAYGDFERNGDADLLCQFFIEEILGGASVGRAFLEARHSFIQKAAPLDPAERKTIAQFNVYGDPSLTPVDLHGLPSLANRSRTAELGSARAERKERRRQLFQRGTALLASEPRLQRSSAKPHSAVARALEAKARELKLRPYSAISFVLRHRAQPQAMPRELSARSSLPSAFHVLFCKRRGAGTRRSKRTPKGILDIIALIATEVGGIMASYRKTHSH